MQIASARFGLASFPGHPKTSVEQTPFDNQISVQVLVGLNLVTSLSKFLIPTIAITESNPDFYNTLAIQTLPVKTKR